MVYGTQMSEIAKHDRLVTNRTAPTGSYWALIAANIGIYMPLI